MGQVLISGPAADPIHLQAMKDHLKVEINDEDHGILDLIRDAVKFIEAPHGRQLVAATWKQTLDMFPLPCGYVAGGDAPVRESAIRLEKGPLVQVTGISYVDTAGVTQTLATSDYTVDPNREPGEVVPAYGEVWPSARLQPNAVEVTYVAGWLTPFTVNTTTNVVTALGRTFATNDRVRVHNSGGGLPAPLAPNTDYYVIGGGSSAFQLAATQGGAAIDLTTDGGGLNFVGELPNAAKRLLKLLVGHWFENREAVLTGSIVAAFPFAVEALMEQLWPGGVS